MDETTYQAIAMIVYFVGMLAIGGWAYGRNNDLDDYMLADRGLNPWVAALSAGASDMSGWLLMGLPGALYSQGLVSAWIAIGLTIGAWLNWRFVAPRLRTYTEVAGNAITIPSFLGNRLHDTRHLLRWASGVIILVYFTFYVSSGMVAGGAFFEGSFGMDYRLGMVLVAAITVVYTLIGGFLAVSYTDFVQGVMMVTALVMVPVAGVIRLGGLSNLTKAIAEVAGCTNASGCDVRGFCAGPVNAMIAAASQVAAGARRNIAVVAGGSIPKLYMNSRDHVKKGLKALEDCVGSFAVLLVPDDGTNPIMRLDVLGKHTVGAGGAPQAVTSALTFEPLQAAGLTFTDVDRFAPELQNSEITMPAGAGDVPLANIKMIAALAVMKKAIEKADMEAFIKKHGTVGYAHTQGHIPAGVPFIGPACEGIRAGKMKRVMIIGKGSLFLARLTNLADGASFLIEAPTGSGASGAAVSKEDVKSLILEALSEIAGKLN